MPELPEVETVRRGLESALVGDIIADVVVRRRDLRVPVPDNLEEILSGASVEQIKRRAKYLLIYPDNEWVVLMHLGMSGRAVVLDNPPDKYAKHDHLSVGFESGKTLLFNDARRFGLVTLARKSGLEQNSLLHHLGVEPLSPSFDAEYLYKALKRRKCPIKQAIMDQKLVVGVGNIYACEALFAVGISPQMSADNITMDKAKRLVQSIKQVLRAAIKSGGSTLRDYVGSSGESGYFQHNFRVYGREGDICTSCEAPIKRIVQGGRSTFYCANCQR